MGTRAESRDRSRTGKCKSQKRRVKSRLSPPACNSTLSLLDKDFYNYITICGINTYTRRRGNRSLSFSSSLGALRFHVVQIDRGRLRLIQRMYLPCARKNRTTLEKEPESERNRKRDWMIRVT